MELERSYASMERISSKLVNYFISFSNNSYGSIWGLPILSQRILYVTQTESQYEVLKSKILSSDNYKELNVLIAKYSDVINDSQLNIYYDLNADKHIKLLGNMSH